MLDTRRACGRAVWPDLLGRCFQHRSVDPSEELFTYAMVTPNGGVKYNSSVAHRPAHRWVYFPRQRADEAVRRRPRSPPAAAGAARHCSTPLLSTC